MTTMKLLAASLYALTALGAALLVSACGPDDANKTGGTMQLEDVKRIVDEYAPSLMAIRGVEGVYVGATKNGDYCVKVMLALDDDSVRAQLPESIEGCPVVVEVTGKIEAYDQDEDD